jgi:ribosome-associated heat shock protein Hsp15
MQSLPLVERLRLDKWLWAARLYKTRALAADEIGRGRVRVNGLPVKPARELKAGDMVEVRHEAVRRQVRVLALSTVRGPAPLAQALYSETEESVRARQEAADAGRLAAEPAASIAQGRPTKRDRRQIERSQVTWHRWSASIDDNGE